MFEKQKMSKLRQREMNNSRKIVRHLGKSVYSTLNTCSKWHGIINGQELYYKSRNSSHLNFKCRQMVYFLSLVNCESLGVHSLVELTLERATTVCIYRYGTLYISRVTLRFAAPEDSCMTSATCKLF